MKSASLKETSSSQGKSVVHGKVVEIILFYSLLRTPTANIVRNIQSNSGINLQNTSKFEYITTLSLSLSCSIYRREKSAKGKHHSGSTI